MNLIKKQDFFYILPSYFQKPVQFFTAPLIDNFVMNRYNGEWKSSFSTHYQSKDARNNFVF